MPAPRPLPGAPRRHRPAWLLPARAMEAREAPRSSTGLSAMTLLITLQHQGWALIPW